MRQHLKRTLAILFGLVCATALLCGSAFAADEVESGTCGENLTWVLDSEGTLTISGSGRMQDYDPIDVFPPWYQYSGSIQSVVLESGVTSIGDFAFQDLCSLPSVALPSNENFTIIPDYAFDSCSSLTGISIPDNVTTIGVGAFGGTGLTSIEIPGSVTVIAEQAFCYCDDLESVTISGDSVSIGEEAFSNCPKLASVTLPEGLTYPDSAFNTTPWWNNQIIDSGACGNNLAWTLDRAGTLTVSGTGEMSSPS